VDVRRTFDARHLRARFLVETREESLRLRFPVGDELVDVGRLAREFARIIEPSLQLVGHADETHGEGLGVLETEARAEPIGQGVLL
jgi:hypothetical protein